MRQDEQNMYEVYHSPEIRVHRTGFHNVVAVHCSVYLQEEQGGCIFVIAVTIDNQIGMH